VNGGSSGSADYIAALSGGIIGAAPLRTIHCLHSETKYRCDINLDALKLDDGTDRLTGFHQIKAFIDALKRQVVRDRY
jgi:hypothetical protein